MPHPKDIGDRTTLAVMLALQDAGFLIATPFGENTRYDLVVDDGDDLWRVQCKTGRVRFGAVVFPTCSSYAHHPNPRITRRSYVGEIDFFGVWCPQLDSVYLVPIEDASSRSYAALRYLPSRNGQRKAIRWAADYEIAAVQVTPGPPANRVGRQRATAGLRASAGAGRSFA
jgi:hypothetical protein